MLEDFDYTFYWLLLFYGFVVIKLASSDQDERSLFCVPCALD